MIWFKDGTILVDNILNSEEEYIKSIDHPVSEKLLVDNETESRLAKHVNIYLKVGYKDKKNSQI